MSPISVLFAKQQMHAGFACSDRDFLGEWSEESGLAVQWLYEHSYHIEFGAKAASYVDTFISAIRWSNADRLFSEVARDAEV